MKSQRRIQLKQLHIQPLFWELINYCNAICKLQHQLQERQSQSIEMHNLMSIKKFEKMRVLEKRKKSILKSSSELNDLTESKFNNQKLSQDLVNKIYQKKVRNAELQKKLEASEELLQKEKIQHNPEQKKFIEERSRFLEFEEKGKQEKIIEDLRVNYYSQLIQLKKLINKPFTCFVMKQNTKEDVFNLQKKFKIRHLDVGCVSSKQTKVRFDFVIRDHSCHWGDIKFFFLYSFTRKFKVFVENQQLGYCYAKNTFFLTDYQLIQSSKSFFTLCIIAEPESINFILFQIFNQIASVVQESTDFKETQYETVITSGENVMKTIQDVE